MSLAKSTGKLLDYRDFLGFGDLFIETGSAAGEGIQRALDAGYAEIHSIEAQKEWFDICQERFRDNPRVILHYGRSSDVLEKPVTEVPYTGVVFFLDAHPSGSKSAGHADVMQFGSQSEFSQHNVILAELKVIFQNYFRPVIMIDDQHGLDLDSERYIFEIRSWDDEYEFEFYDENLGGNHFYKDKILVAVPGGKWRNI